MPNPKINGSAAVNVKPVEVSYDPKRGLSVRRRYTAAGGDAELIGIEASAQAAGCQTRKLISPVLSELEVVSPELDPNGGGDLIVTDQWQVVGNEITKSMYEHPLSLYVEELEPGALSFVKNKVREYGESESIGPAFFSPPFSSPTVNELVTMLFNCLIRGQESFLLGQYVLRHTTNCSANSTSNVSDFNVFKVYTTAQLLAEAQDSSLWTNPIATRLVTKIGAIPEPDARLDYLWGWLKKPSTETTTPDNRIEITTEYWLEQWSLFTYQAA